MKKLIVIDTYGSFRLRVIDRNVFLNALPVNNELFFLSLFNSERRKQPFSQG